MMEEEKKYHFFEETSGSGIEESEQEFFGDGYDRETDPEEFSFPGEPTQDLQIPGNEAIMASAGTGKTFSLAMRYITLLRAGVTPGRILACTFTKKAAGEIYDKIAEELIGLSVSEEKIKQVVKNFPLLGKGNFHTGHASWILGRLLKSKERLQISTLDSFFVNIIRTFPLECGIFGELSIMEESDSRSRVSALLALLREIPEEDRKEIMEIVKEASFGENNKCVYGTVKQLIFSLYDRFLICPEKQLWCSAGLHDLVPGSYFTGKKQLEKIAENYLEMVKSFLAVYGDNLNTQRLQAYFSALLSDALKAEENPMIGKQTGSFWEKFTSAYPSFPVMEKELDSFELTYNRKKYLLEGELYRNTVILMRHILYCNIFSLVRRNEALWRILDLFNRKYALLVRSSGRIAFSDIPYLLRPSENHADTDLALPFSDREGIEERLDEKTDHFLIDEFQDTSDSQWNAISRLAEEAIVDSDAKRSFFYVGDIKQSIYQWRNGNPGLFNMILNKYPESLYGERGIRKHTLIESYRSCNEVLEMVNTVFMNPEGVYGLKGAEEEEKERIFSVMKRLQYEKHFSAPSAAEQKGYSGYFQLPPVSRGNEKNAREEKFRCVYDLLISLDPFQEECPFSVGVLFRTNNTASEFAECVRRFNQEDLIAGKKVFLPVSLDSRLSVKESLFCVLAYYVLLGTAHPGSKFVKKMFEMLQLGKEKLDQKTLAGKMGYPDTGLSGEDTLFQGVRMDLANGGFEQFFRRFRETFREKIDSFDERRLESLIEAARKYDLQGLDDIDSFLELAYEEAGNEISLRNTVQCMTYHKSKGLAFDIVILPDINGDGLSAVKLHDGVFMDKDPVDFSPRFLTAFPKKTFLKCVPLLDDFASRLKKENAYESCCMLYVAMTRAKHALYLFGNESGKESTRVNMAALCAGILGNGFPRMITENLSCLWEKGDDAWHIKERELFREKKNTGKNKGREKENLVSCNRLFTEKCLNKLQSFYEEPVPEKSRILFPEQDILHASGKPSQHTEWMMDQESAGSTKVFSCSAAAADLGTKVHELFCRIGFYDGKDGEEYVKRLFGESILQTEEGRILLQALQYPLIRSALSHPGTPFASLYQEKPFLLPDWKAKSYVKGIFDRLVAEYDENEQCTGAVVIDYKSDREEKEEVFLQRYSRQLNIYRKAAASLLKLPEEKVICRILALRSGKVITVPAEK